MKVSEEVRKFLSECGKKGGSSKSRRKKETARMNGRLGGRPKTKPTGGREK